MFLEKFALLNLIKVLDGLVAPKDGHSGEQKDGQGGAPELPREDKKNAQSKQQENANILAGALYRHEALSYRVKNKPRG